MSTESIYEHKLFPGTDPTTFYNKYPDVNGIDPEKFVLTSDGLLAKHPEKVSEALNQIKEHIDTQSKTFLGYQVNRDFKYSENLSEYLNSHLNNIGDPFQEGNFTLNTKFVERAVLDYFASLWNAKWPHIDKPNGDSDDKSWQETYWGYVLSMGSSEGNIYALWNARDYLAGRYLVADPDADDAARKASRNGRPHSARRRYKRFSAPLPENNCHAYTPIAFYSEDTHYSIIKDMRVMAIDTFYEKAQEKRYRCPLIPHTSDYPANYSYEGLGENGWPDKVPSNDDGSVYIPALIRLVDFFSAKGYPVLICFNFGTTFKGALDNVKEAVDSMVPILKRNNMYEREVIYGYDKQGNPLKDTRTGFWFHVDGALGAGYVPFLREEKTGYYKDKLPVFDFSIPQLHSINMSGHKWIGSPWPCGVFMSKVKYQLKPVSDPHYIGSADSTFSGSRNGFSALILWDFLSKNSVKDLAEKAVASLELIKVFMQNFEKVQEKHKEKYPDLWLEHSPNALTVRFRKANPELTHKYSLSSEVLYVNGEKREYSHIFFMNSVDTNLIDQFTQDLLRDDAFDQSEQAESDDFTMDIIDSGLGFR